MTFCKKLHTLNNSSYLFERAGGNILDHLIKEAQIYLYLLVIDPSFIVVVLFLRAFLVLHYPSSAH